MPKKSNHTDVFITSFYKVSYNENKNYGTVWIETFQNWNFGGKSRATSAWAFTYNHTENLTNKTHTEAVYTPTELTLLCFPHNYA